MFSQNCTDFNSGVAERNFQAIWPWRAEPYKVWSLFDMIRSLHVGNFGAFMVNFERVYVYADMILNPAPLEKSEFLLRNSLPRFSDALLGILDTCSRGEVPISHVVKKQLEEFLKRIQDAGEYGLDYKALAENARIIRQALIDDLSQHLFICIPADYRELIDQTSPPFGPQVAQAFGPAKRDIEASCRCLALSEWTASVFHLMRVLEHGLHELADRVGLPSKSMALENWKNVIDQIEAQIKAMEKEPKGTAKSAKLKTYSSAAVQFRYFKDAWRNHVSHGRDTYDERESQSILNHVKEFMQSLASETNYESKAES